MCWFKMLVSEGQKYGYFPEPIKSVLVVQGHLEEEAKILFGDLGVKIVSGSRFLGEFVESSEGCETIVRSMVEKWVHSVQQ